MWGRRAGGLDVQAGISAMSISWVFFPPPECKAVSLSLAGIQLNEKSCQAGSFVSQDESLSWLCQGSRQNYKTLSNRWLSLPKVRMNIDAAQSEERKGYLTVLPFPLEKWMRGGAGPFKGPPLLLLEAQLGF